MTESFTRERYHALCQRPDRSKLAATPRELAVHVGWRLLAPRMGAAAQRRGQNRPAQKRPESESP
jgi:hypothetical protein